jgi:FKBP-type peptidyl-prolyl cis-trans isomerase 2
MDKKVTEGSKVTVHYVGKLDDGNEFDNSYVRNAPLTFEVGKGQMIPGFESALLNREENEKFEVKIPKDQAYGDYSEANLHEIEKQTLLQGNSEIPPIGSQLQGTRPDGKTFLCVLKEVKEETAVLDMNHPLAGKDLNFSIEILNISN